MSRWDRDEQSVPKLGAKSPFYLLQYLFTLLCCFYHDRTYPRVVHEQLRPSHFGGVMVKGWDSSAGQRRRGSSRDSVIMAIVSYIKEQISYRSSGYYVILYHMIFHCSPCGQCGVVRGLREQPPYDSLLKIFDCIWGTSLLSSFP